MPMNYLKGFREPKAFPGNLIITTRMNKINSGLIIIYRPGDTLQQLVAAPSGLR